MRPHARAVVLPAALLLAAAARAAAAGAQPAVLAGPVVVSELLASPANASADEQRSWVAAAGATEWFELHNTSPDAAVNLSGWCASDGGGGPPRAVATSGAPGCAGWALPAGTALPRAAFYELPPVPAGSNVLVASGLRVSRRGIALFDARGQLAAATGRLPEQRPGVAFGLPAGPPPAAAGAPNYTFLASPTPWLPNAGPLPGAGPFVHSLERCPDGPAAPGRPIGVAAEVGPNRAAVSGAALVYRVNFGPEARLDMAPEGPPDASGRVTLVGSIPASAFKAGDMVRWSVEAADADGAKSREPLGDGYTGAVVPLPAEAASPIPVLYWLLPGVPKVGELKLNSYYAELGENSMMKEVVAYQARWARRARCALSVLCTLGAECAVRCTAHPRPAPRGSGSGSGSGAPCRRCPPHAAADGAGAAAAVAAQVMAEQGVLAPLSFHVAVYLNGAFHGLFGMVEQARGQLQRGAVHCRPALGAQERDVAHRGRGRRARRRRAGAGAQVDAGLLQRFSLPGSGPLFKSLSGELSNLRWDLPLDEMPNYWGKRNRRGDASDWQLLANLTRGLAGGGPGTRCTKNFYMYFNPGTQQWARIAWDVEASMGQDNALGGAPGNLYCILACEQWSSPLYCDSEHPQARRDIGNVQTPWGTITAVGGNPYQGAAAPGSTGRRRLAQQAAPAPLPAEGSQPLVFPQPRGWDDPDRVDYSTRSVIGAAGTYNHLTDALLDVPATRAMVMARLRTLADHYLAGGRLREARRPRGRARRGPCAGSTGPMGHSRRTAAAATAAAVAPAQIIDATRARIEAAAAADNALWGRGDGSRGYAQLVTEFIPIRTKQLLQTYAPGGARPLLPGPADAAAAALALGPAELAASPPGAAFMALVHCGPPGRALDMSRWSLRRLGGPSWTLPPGTVLPPGGTLHLSPDVRAFRARAASPKAGEAALVLLVPPGFLPDGAGGAAWALADEQGRPVQLAAA
ncbi:hypothetical protein HT031_005885 [Scenedesmus sp. PABB004]|nr:hypothetical protein HT031_005885 [Scenedesmus sp. PABB004]